MTIYVAGNVIGGTIFGHLQIVYGSDELEVQAPRAPGDPLAITDDYSRNPFFGRWQFADQRPHQNEDNTPGFSDPRMYARIAIDTGSMSSVAAFEILRQCRVALNSEMTNSTKSLVHRCP